ncbi:MAG TPA: redoxin family protein, partial [Flavisolibacter sp.]|nr:redoxin family protein [Flavisolibacter sp.]
MLCCFTSLHAQEYGAIDAGYPKVQHIAVKASGTDTFVRIDSATLQVFVFLSPECPLCKNYSLVLNTLQKKFGKKVQFAGIVPGRTYTDEDVQQFVKDYKVQFPVYIDLQKELSNYVKATTTPEVVLLNKSGGLVYRGAIDDWVQALGQNKAKPKQRYLEDAIS